MEAIEMSKLKLKRNKLPKVKFSELSKDCQDLLRAATKLMFENMKVPGLSEEEKIQSALNLQREGILKLVCSDEGLIGFELYMPQPDGRIVGDKILGVCRWYDGEGNVLPPDAPEYQL
jgi:hypothetical protein